MLKLVMLLQLLVLLLLQLVARFHPHWPCKRQ